jgi:hypothetical protein
LDTEVRILTNSKPGVPTTTGAVTGGPGPTPTPRGVFVADEMSALYTEFERAIYASLEGVAS